MATTPVEFRAPAGMTLTLDLYPYGSDTRANGSGDSATEETNRDGVYQADVTEAITGWHTSHAYSSGTLVAAYDVYLEDDTDVHRCHDAPPGLPGPAADAAGGLVISDAGGLDIDAAMADVYYADINFNEDAANSQDEYTITWFKNDARVTSGITSPTIQVVKRADGTDLVASSTTSQIGSTGSYKHDESSNRLGTGESALVIVTATIDAGSRTWSKLVSRDSNS